MTLTMWAWWAVILLAQNFSFTFVSRARNSGSLGRHIKAALASNGVWFASQAIAINAFLAIVTGKFGFPMAIFAGTFYTVFTVIGLVLAHYYSLRTEKGKSAVGANAKYAHIAVEEYEALKTKIAKLEDALINKVEEHIPFHVSVVPPPMPGQGMKL